MAVDESFRLLMKASEDMGIQQGNTESYDNWVNRVIYSAVGNMAYVSLWDQIDENENASLIHFRQRIRETYEAWKYAVPSAKNTFTVSPDELAEEILITFEQAGVVYRHPYRIAPGQEAYFNGHNCTFFRSPALYRNLLTSGLGFYSHEKYEKGKSFGEVFAVDEHPLIQIADHYTQNLNFRRLETDKSIEYCRLDRRNREDYWKRTPDTDGRISILRIKEDFQSLYYFYTFSDGELLVSQLPEWLSADGMYLYLSTALMKKYGNSPKISYSEKGAIVIVRLEYLLPPPEMNMFRLYSWPLTFDGVKDSFQRIMSKDCFLEFKVQLIKKGFTFNGG